VVFREIRYVFKQEVVPREKEPDKIDFELKDNESDSTEEHESEEKYPHTSVLRRSIQERRQLEMYTPPDFHSNFSLFIIYYDLRTVREAMDLEDEKIWKNTMVDEMKALENNEAWDLVELSTGRNPIGRKWLFKKKLNAEGNVEKYKDRLVAKVYSQV
jgi:hypothetical protein